MFGALIVISVIWAIVEVTKEAMEKPTPPETRFDWDAYWEDIGKIPMMEQIKKRERGKYNTTKPLSKEDPTPLPFEYVSDYMRGQYEKDKEIYGEKLTEQFKKWGTYSAE